MGGIALMQNEKFHLRVEANKEEAKAILCKNGEDIVIGSAAVKDATKVKATILVEGLLAKVLVAEADVRELSTEVAGGFVGCCVGMYASANGEEKEGYIAFKAFSYEAK